MEVTYIIPVQKELLGQLLEPTKNEGNKIAQSILIFTGRVVPQLIVQYLTLVEREKGSKKPKREDFDNIIKDKLGDSMILPRESIKAALADEFDFNQRSKDEDEPTGWIDGDHGDTNFNPAFKYSGSNIFINDEVLLPQGGELNALKVKSHHVSEGGRLFG